MKFALIIFVNTVAQTQEMYSFLSSFKVDLIWVILELSKTFCGKYFCTNIQLLCVFEACSVFSHNTRGLLWFAEKLLRVARGFKELLSHDRWLPDDLECEDWWWVHVFLSPDTLIYLQTVLSVQNLFSFKLSFCIQHTSAPCVSLSKSHAHTSSHFEWKISTIP